MKSGLDMVHRMEQQIMKAGLSLLLILIQVGLASAQNTGKIAGTIRDKQTQDPIIGANVIVKGTTLGAVTDDKGFYYILRVPPGEHDLQISYLGYKSVIVKAVRVQVDLTTEINIVLEQSAMQFGEVVVTAEHKLVQKDITFTRRTITQDNMKETPGMYSTEDIFRYLPGAVISTSPQSISMPDGSSLQVRDESLKDIHIRGGRGGEILYMVDGMPVTHPIYGGRSVLDLNLVDVQSVDLLTGAFNAEYGQAQSGVVNIVTRSGGEHFRGGVEFKTDQWKALGASTRTKYASLYLGGPEPISGKLLRSLGLELPGEMSYFVSANFTLTNTPYNNGKSRGSLSLFGFGITEEQDNTQNINAKLSWDITSERHFALSYHGSWKQWTDFEWLWQNYPDRIPDYRRPSYTIDAMFSQVLSKSTYFNLNLEYLGVGYKVSWNGKRPSDFWTVDSSGNYVSTISAPQVDPSTGFYDSRGFENIWRDDRTGTWTFKGDLTSQIHPAHLMKTGIEISYNDISYVDIEDGGVKLSRYGQKLDSIPPPGPFPEFGQNRWVFHVKPVIGGGYIQDKFELEFLIINAGVRVDWFSLGQTVMQSEWKSTWERATGLKADWKSMIFKVSPRFGISFPISEQTVIFFSYGHFNQLPELQYYYRDPYTGGIVGNPKLDFEQTILYEFGATHQLSEDWAVDIKSYAKDISKLVGGTRVYGTEGIPVELFDNKGYGRARGLELALTKSQSHYFSGMATYTLQWANGYSSSAFDDYIRSITNFPYPIRERPLEWDVRHQLILQGMIAAGENDHPSIFGLKLPDNWIITVLYRFSTGTPYTPGDATVNPVDQQKRENTATGPPFSSTDFKMEKGFVIGGVKFALVADVFNLFDEKNVQMAYGFNTWTGKPFRYGDLQKPQPNFYDYYTMLSMMDPRQFSNGRTTELGIRVDF